MDATTAFGDSSSTVSLKRSSISDTVDFASPPLPAPLAPPNIPIEDLNGELEDDDDDDDDRDTNDGAQDGARKKPRLSSSTTTAQASRPMCTNCEQCQIRKGKCDRGMPRCGWCTVNDKVCQYKEKRKPGLKPGFGQDLERRLYKAEQLLESHSRVLETLARKDGGPKDEHGSTALESQTFASPTYARSFSTHTDSPHTSSQSGRNLTQANADKFGLQSVSPTLPTAASLGQGLTNGKVPQSPQYEDLPPYDLLYSLVDLYFTHINTWCPVLERRSTLNTLFGSAPLEEGDRVLLHAIVATTLRFSTDARLSEYCRKTYHDNSKQKVLLYGLENSSVRGLQALVILVLDFIGSANGGAGLKLIALIVRSMIQLGLNTESFSPTLFPDYPSISTLRANILPEPENWIEDESRRRLFWMIYILDRDATVATAFEFALDERDIDRKLPCKDDLFARNQFVETRWFRTHKRSEFAMNRPQNLGTFSYQVEIKGMLSKIHQFLRSPVDISALGDVESWQSTYRELDSMLRSWQVNLPNEFGNIARLTSSNTTALSCGWISLQASYYLALIRLHSSAAYPPHKSPIFGPSYAASQQCYSSVENIIALAHYVVNNKMLAQIGPHFAFSLWVAARVLLVHGSTIEKYVSQDIHFLVDTMQKMGRHWPVAVRYWRILKRVIDEYQESLATMLPNGTKATPSSVTILADMRRCAYDLDVLISSQPRSSQTQTQQQTPSQKPRNNGPSELEYQYLEAFDFFNYPRLPVPLASSANGMIDPSLQRFDANQFNINNFSVDVNSDWLAGNFT